jgi:phage baseplate assembly protein W
MNIAYPLYVDQKGLLASVSDEQHIEQLIQQVLFTMPGERVNLPDFGTGLSSFVFSATSSEIISAVQLLVQGALQQWLGNLIQVQVVQITADNTTLNITIAYVIKSTKQQVVSQFSS